MLKDEEIRDLLNRGEKVNLECKLAESKLPASVFDTYSSFANTNGGTVLLGVEEVKRKGGIITGYNIEGIQYPDKLIGNLWNSLNDGEKVNINILSDENVYKVDFEGKTIVVIEIPRARFDVRPVHIGKNPFTGSYKRNNEGDYHCTRDEVRAMIRDQSPEGTDNMVLENYGMDDIDPDTLHRYRNVFGVENPEHVWNAYDNKAFLEQLGGYRVDRRKGIEGITLAGLLMFGKGLQIRDRFHNIFMDYRDESYATPDIRWQDRVTYDGTWENNLYNFFSKVVPKLTADLKKPFRLEGITRIDDTPVHKAVREGFVNMIIHADYLSEGTLKVIKTEHGFSYTNPGTLKIPKEQIYKGGDSMARNPHMQTMLRMVGYGDNAGSGFPTILSAWKDQGWPEPELIEDTVLNQVTLVMSIDDIGRATQVATQVTTQVDDALIEERQKKLLDYCSEPRSRKEMMNFIGLAGDKNFRKKYLIPLLESGDLIMTIPDKPTSRLQRYVSKKQ